MRIWIRLKMSRIRNPAKKDIVAWRLGAKPSNFQQDLLQTDKKAVFSEKVSDIFINQRLQDTDRIEGRSCNKITQKGKSNPDRVNSL
jgi:hypothetical protein